MGIGKASWRKWRLHGGLKEGGSSVGQMGEWEASRDCSPGRRVSQVQYGCGSRAGGGWGETREGSRLCLQGFVNLPGTLGL